MRLLVLALALSVGCSGGDTTAADARPLDRWPPQFDDFRQVPDARPAPPCSKTCPPVSGSKICLHGHVFDAPALLGYWAGHPSWTLHDLQNPDKGALITTNKDAAVVKVYDPIDFVSNLAGAVPLAEVDIDDNGCFVVEDVSIPFSNLFIIAVDDKLATDNVWALGATGDTPTAGQSSSNLMVAAVSQQTASDWGHDFLADGTMLAVFKHRIKDKGVEGVLPTFDGKPPVKDADAGAVAGQWEFPGTNMDVFYMAADPTDAKTIVDPAADKTTRSGIVLIRKMELKAMTGEKDGCAIWSRLGVSAPNTLFFRIFDVEGC